MKYSYSNVDNEYVQKNIGEYIIPELQEACKILWDKNIFTFMCSDYDNRYFSFVSFFDISNENLEILKNLTLEQDGKLDTKTKQIVRAEGTKKNLPTWYGNYAIYVSGTNIKENGKKLAQLVKNFKMQDVPSEFYMTKEEYLIKCGCFKEEDNPDYKNVDMMEYIEKNALSMSMQEVLDFLDNNTPKIKVFDPDKVTKSIEEYVKENGDEDKFDNKTGKVYNSKFYLDKHKKYENYISGDIEK